MYLSALIFSSTSEVFYITDLTNQDFLFKTLIENMF